MKEIESIRISYQKPTLINMAARLVEGAWCHTTGSIAGATCVGGIAPANSCNNGGTASVCCGTGPEDFSSRCESGTSPS